MPLNLVLTAPQDSQPPPSLVYLHKIVPVILESPLDSRSALPGDLVIARLKEDLYFGQQLIARQNSVLKGQVISTRSSRTLSESAFQKEDRLKSTGAIGIQFNKLIINQSQSMSLTALPAHQESFRNTTDGYLYGVTVDHQGRIVQAGKTLSKSQQDSYNMLRVGTNAPLPASILLNLTAGPAVMGVVGAASPDLAFNKPIDHTVSHRRLKGAAYAFLTNLPGAFFVQAIVEKGNEVSLSNGDEFMIDLIIDNQINPLSTKIASGQPGTIINPETLIVEGKVLNRSSSSSRLLPADPPNQNNSKGLALKPYILSNDLN